jgi:hypothetical protein
MDFQKFTATLEENTPPLYLSQALVALWYDSKGNWEKAHDIAQDMPHQDGAWIHAYLHRKEGDLWNADYWYQKANRKMPRFSLEEEWVFLAKHFLSEK